MRRGRRPRSARRQGRRARDRGAGAAVVVGWTRSFDFDLLAASMTVVRSGARLIGTNDDPTYPTPAGLIPGAGSILAAVAPGLADRARGRRKALRARWRRWFVTGHPTLTLVVGDRPATDGLFAKRLGVPFALVHSGVTPANHGKLEAGARPRSGRPCRRCGPGARPVATVGVVTSAGWTQAIHRSGHHPDLDHPWPGPKSSCGTWSLRASSSEPCAGLDRGSGEAQPRGLRDARCPRSAPRSTASWESAASRTSISTTSPNVWRRSSRWPATSGRMASTRSRNRSDGTGRRGSDEEDVLRQDVFGKSAEQVVERRRKTRHQIPRRPSRPQEGRKGVERERRPESKKVFGPDQAEPTTRAGPPPELGRIASPARSGAGRAAAGGEPQRGAAAGRGEESSRRRGRGRQVLETRRTCRTARDHGATPFRLAWRREARLPRSRDSASSSMVGHASMPGRRREDSRTAS